MTTFDNIFTQKKAFIAYLTAGHPDLDYTVEAACTLVQNGVDILEIGVPFSDPIADGPSIQAAMTTALSKQFSLNDIFNSIAQIKKRMPVPIVLFSYLNPILTMGFKKVCREAKNVGVDALLIVDLPLEESKDYFHYCQEFDLAPICLLSPSTSLERAERISENSKGFLYYVCQQGTTGMRKRLPAAYASQMQALKLKIKQPIVAGFGISNQTMAAEAIALADGFVVGSAFVQAINDGASITELGKLATIIDPRKNSERKEQS